MQIPETTMDNWGFLQRTFHLLVRAILPRFMRAFFKFEVHQSHYGNKFPEGIPVIYCINHRSHLDSLILASAIAAPYGTRTRAALMASGKAMQKNRFFGLTRFLGAFPVFREKPDEALAFARKSLKKGITVVIAPQGKRVRGTPYHEYFNLANEGRTGVGRLVLDFNGKVPVIPAYIRGSAEALSQGTIIPRFRSPLSVSFGPPMFWDEYTRKGGWNKTHPDFFPTAREIANRIMAKIREQLIIQEKHLFAFLECKFGASIDEICIPPERKRSFDKLVSKLLRIHPKQLQELIQSGSKP
jgi:1-acyl-sn-glycerol-3-phosphate acyltransferase